MFTEADDSLPELVSPQTIREGPQLPLYLRPRIHVRQQLPERQPAAHIEGSYKTCSLSRDPGSIIIHDYQK